MPNGAWSNDSNFPTMRLEIGSLSCWAPGYQFIYDHILKVVELFGGIIIKELVSEVHLAADFIDTNIRKLQLDEKYWVTRAHTYTSN